MKNIIIIILAVIAGAAGYAAIQNNTKKEPAEPVYYVNENAVQKTQKDYTKVKDADEMLNTLVDNAGKNHPDELTSVGMQKEAVNAMGQILNDTKDPEEKLLTAAAGFFGAYYTNVKERYDFCMQRGVSLKPFVELFKENNAAEYNRSIEVLKKNGYTAEALEKEIAPQLKRAIEIDMNDVAKGLRTDMKKACQFMNDKRLYMVKELSFKKRLPDAYSILMAGE